MVYFQTSGSCDIDKSILALKAKVCSASSIAKQIGGGMSRNGVLGRLHRMKCRGIDTSLRALILAAPAEPVPVAPALTPPPERPAPADAVAPPVVEKRPGFTLPEGQAGVALDALRSSSCRWPYSAAGGATLYCGEPAAPGASYCPSHAALAYARRLTDAERAEQRLVHAGLRRDGVRSAREIAR